jgi:hypothetical protein
MANKVNKLRKELGYYEFCIQLVMYEKACSREEAIIRVDNFMEDDVYTSIVSEGFYTNKVDTDYDDYYENVD